MSYVNINENLFLEKQELNRIISFLSTAKGGTNYLQLQELFTAGVIKSGTDTNFDNCRVLIGGTSGTIKLNDSIAINNSGQLIYYKATDNIAIPNDGNYYWISLTHAYSPIEVGTVSIDTQGHLTGTGTLFTDVFRGIPNFPVKVKFYNTSLNVGEYEVLSVASDTSAILTGSFSAESSLSYSIIGSFTEDYVVPTANKEIYQYDSATLSQLQYNLDVTTIPPSLTLGVNIVLARVLNVSGTLQIEDRRNVNIYRERVENLQRELSVMTNLNNICAVESVLWQSPTTGQGSNSVVIGWGFRSTNWTINSNLNILSIITGSGGLAKSTTDIVNDQFNGWRVYNTNGTYSTVTDTVVVGSQINLYLDTLNPIDFTASSLITVVPNAEEIELILEAEGFSPNDSYAHNVKQLFSIQDATAIISLAVFNSATDQTEYKLTYRLKNNQIYSPIFNDSSTANVYYNELAFDTEGNLTDPTKTTTGLVDSFLLQLNTDAFYNLLSNLNTNDLEGVDTISGSSFSNASPLLTLQTGVNHNYIIVNCSNFSSSTDLILNLLTTGAKAGSSFTIDFKTQVTLTGSDSFTVNVDYVNPGSPGTVIFSFNNTILLKNSVTGFGELKMKFVFDGNDSLWKPIWVFNEPFLGPKEWLPATLNTGYVIDSALTPSVDYTIDSQNYVSLRGALINPSTAAPGTTLFTLPSGFWPSHNMYFSITAYNAASTSYVSALILIGTTGIVSFVVTSSFNITSVNSIVFLDGIKFNTK